MNSDRTKSIALGLIVHFAITLRRSARRREADEATPEGAAA